MLRQDRIMPSCPLLCRALHFECASAFFGFPIRFDHGIRKTYNAIEGDPFRVSNGYQMTQQSGLLSSAKEFVIEAISNYRDLKNNFAIVHAVTATELLLKERLARINPSLIYKNIDALTFRSEKTISLVILPQRLKNFGVILDAGETELIKCFSDWRNQIVHHMPPFDGRESEAQLPRLLDFLAKFLRKELEILLEDFLPLELYPTAAKLLKEWERVAEQARTRAQKEGNVLSEICPVCGTTGAICLREDRLVFCHLCEVEHYRYDHCTGCGKRTISLFSAWDEGNFCQACIDAAGDNYIELLSEIERGK